MVKALALSLALTLALESLFGQLWGLRSRRDRLLLLAVNTVTNPIAVALVWRVSDGLAFTLALEAAVVLAEWPAYRKWGQKTHPALLFSLCVNCFSYCSGLLLQTIW